MTPYQRRIQNIPKKETRRQERERHRKEIIQKLLYCPKIMLTEEQYKQLFYIWLYVYGNNASKHTRQNHKYIQTFLEQGLDMSEWYDMTEECYEAVKEILPDVI